MSEVPREYLAFVERVLKEHPARVSELERLDGILSACCRPASVGAAGTGGAVSEPERILLAKEGDIEYQKLFRRVETVKRALGSLTEQERTFVEIFFWREMSIRQTAEELHMDKTTAWRTKKRVAERVIPFLIGQWA
jgi:RinA family phage transcriptional activator